MTKHLDTILQKEMTRKEFLATMGFGVASIMGFGTIIRLLTGKSHGLSRQTTSGYGSSAYGGNKESR